MSDRECRADRICHDGTCRFIEEVRAELTRGPEIVEDAGKPPDDAAKVAATVPGAGANTGQAPGTGLGMFMGDARHTGRMSTEGPVASVREAWVYRTGARIYASPVVASDGSIVIGSLDHTLTAVAPEGTLRFRHSGTGKFYASAAVAPNGDIIAGSSDGSLVALTKTGQLRFQHKLGDAIDASIVIDATRIYVAADGLYAFELSGKQLWHYPVGAHVRSAPAVHPAGLIVFGTPQGKVIAVKTDGTLGFQVEAGANMDGGPSIADDGRILIGTDAGHVLALDPSGKLLFRFETGGDVRATPAVMRDGTAIVGSYDRNLYAIAPDGALRWKVTTGGRIRSSARIDARGNIYVGSQDDFVYGIAPNGSVLFRHNVGRDVDSSPVIDTRGHLLIGADDGGLYALQ
jgi:outer membrane protein assembly factor BamB